ncbi:hypothetical protein D3C84_472860 [compost metagenome]
MFPQVKKLLGTTTVVICNHFIVDAMISTRLSWVNGFDNLGNPASKLSRRSA